MSIHASCGYQQMTTIFNNFINRYSLSKTLRFELKPQGKTLDWVNERGIIQKDVQRAQDYKVVKKLIDECHKAFIDKVLTSEEAYLDWQPLASLVDMYREEKEPSTRLTIASSLEKEKAAMRKKIVALFKNEDNKAYLKALFSKDLILKVLPEYLREHEGTPEQFAAVQSFNKFTSYFVGFNTVRENLYSDEDKASTIATRIVEENFTKFYNACRQYSLAKQTYPDAVIKTEKLLQQNLDQYFEINAYNNYLSQSGIEQFNAILGGWVDIDGNKIQGLNECLNEAYQQDINKTKRIHLEPLYKQILSDREGKSFYIEAFKDDKQMADTIINFTKAIRSTLNEETGEIYSPLSKLSNLFLHIENYDLSKIYVKKQNYTKLSQKMFGSWSVIPDCIARVAEEAIGPCEGMKKKDRQSWGKAFLSLSDIESVLAACSVECKWDVLGKTALELMRAIDFKQDGLYSVLKDATTTSYLQQNRRALGTIKNYLDAVQDYYHLVILFSSDQNLDCDTDFYYEYLECLNVLSAIKPLYNKTRNRLSKKPYSDEKFKLNFDSPVLADGWDISQERTKLTIILRKDGKYYLGILAVGAKPDKEALKDNPSADDYYEKMEYKLIPNPFMQLPKVAFSKKGLETYKPSESLVEGYKAKKHIKSNVNFDLSFCHELIDFFKTVCLSNPDWSVFDFKFSPTRNYRDISEFYREVETSGYSIKFAKVATSEIDELVENGSLYLFQIYNSDYALGHHGAFNLHTLYFENLFSKANLKDSRFKLSGGAEVFYRFASITNPTTHEVGEKVVNRWITLPNGTKTPLPESVHGEIYRFANGKLDKDKLSDQARKYLDTGNVVIKDVKQRIIKDRRFTEDKFFLHLPITINFASDNNNYLNYAVCEYLYDNSDVNIIGIDRGERCMLHATVINQKGEILEQRNLNVIDGYDYHAKLVERAKERDEQRKSWQSVDGIKNLKNGYISQAVKIVTDLMVEYNAIVVMEDLNTNFKRNRACIDTQTYQKFEKMLIDKLNYLVVSKDPDSVDENGKTLRGYQLANKFESFEMLGKQSGFIFYVSPWHTQTIDPSTGFINLFPYKELNYSNEKAAKNFFSKFEKISFNEKKNYFEFAFDYSKFETPYNPTQLLWTACSTSEERSNYVQKNGRWVPEKIDVNKRLKDLFEQADINYKNGNDLIEAIQDMSVPQVKELLMLFKTLMMLHYRTNDKDYVVSPVANEKGKFFSTTSNSEIHDADSVSSYCVALKGLQYATEEIVFNEEKERYQLAFSQKQNELWLNWMQTKPFLS